MKSLIYAIGDVHGKHELFEKLIHYYDPKIHQLVLLGDLNDRGPRTKECFLLGKQLVEETGAIYLRGNHEEYFLQFLQSPEDWYAPYMRNGGKETFESLIHPGASEEYSPTEISMMIQSRYSELIKFLVQRPLYYEWENYLFVHAGVDLTKKDWRKTSLRDFIWIREPFHEGKTIQVRQLYLDIRLHQCSMEICRQQTSGFRIIKSEWTVGLYSEGHCMGLFLTRKVFFKILNIRTTKDLGMESD